METVIEKARRIRAFMEKMSIKADDIEILEAPEICPYWRAGEAVLTGDRRFYAINNTLYKCLQDHTTTAEWTPVDAPSLWAKVLIPDETIIPAWEQPDSTNPYNTGDKVSHNGQTWVSVMDGNVWEPGVYGWEVIE